MSVKRLHKDIADMMAKDIHDLGIYYAPADETAYLGWGLIFGPPDTPYADCPLLFSVDIPKDYPFQSPRVKIVTSDGRTRFHPNLYVEGKVCLSILGTFTGPSWVSTMSLETVFKSIHSLLNDNPITNEPGYEKVALSEPRAAGYAAWVRHALLLHTLHEIQNFRSAGIRGERHMWEPFREILEREMGARLGRIRAELVTRVAEGDQSYGSLYYSMSGTTRWASLKRLCDELCAEGGGGAVATANLNAPHAPAT